MHHSIFVAKNKHMQDDEPGSCFVKTDHRPSAVTVNCELLGAPWNALYADAMALDRVTERPRRRAATAVALRKWKAEGVWSGGDEVVMQPLGREFWACGWLSRVRLGSITKSTAMHFLI
jgi:hypothetical protein